MNKKHFRETLTLAVPIIFGYLGHMMMSVTDSVMVGRIGAPPLAASALAHGISFLIMVFGFGLSMGLTPLVAEANGSGEVKKCGDMLRQGLILNVVASVVLFILTYVASELLGYMHQPPDIIGPASSYMKILGVSIFPIMIFQTYKQFAEGLSVIKAAMVITLLANIVNVMVNWVFIYGNLGCPALGLNGAGLGTLLSRVFMAVAMIVVVKRSAYLKAFDSSLASLKPDWRILKSLIRVGVPTGFQYVFEVSSFTGASVVVGWIGVKELAAHQIALNLASISYMFSLGISSAATVRVGTAHGRKDYRETLRAGFSAVGVCVMFMVCFAFMFIALRDRLPSFYISDLDVIRITSQLLIIVGVFQIFDGSQAVGVGMLRGLMDINVPTAITFGAYWGIGLPIAYLLGISRHYGVIGVWLGLFLGLSSSALMMLVRFYRINRMRYEVAL